MAVILGKSPVTMTATNDAIVGNWKITVIRCVTGASSGVFILTDGDGHEILKTRSLQANDDSESGALDYWVDGLTVTQIPSGGTVYVYYE